MDIDIQSVLEAGVSIILLLAGNKLIIEKKIISKVKEILKPIEKKIDDGDLIHQKLMKESQGISKYLDFKKSNEDHIEKMHQIKSYYVSKFVVESYKNFALYKADCFISVIEKTINNEKLGVNDIDSVINSLNSGYTAIKVEMLDRMPKSYVEIFFNEHRMNYEIYLNNVENILSDFDNHHKDKLLKESTFFLKQFLQTLKSAQVRDI